MFAAILSIIKGLLLALGWAKEKSDQNTGAALSEGKASASELERITRAVDAGNADSMPIDKDPNNRDNADGKKSSGV